MPDDSDLSNAAGKLTVITDLESNPVTVDHNPAHFDGFLHEIAEWSQRTGKFLELLEHGITFRGSKTVVDSPAAIPFFQGKVTNAKTYSADDPCPPTEQRIRDHNDAATSLGTPQIVPYTRDPDDSNIIVLTRSLSVPTTSPSVPRSPTVSKTLTTSTGFVTSAGGALEP